MPVYATPEDFASYVEGIEANVFDSVPADEAGVKRLLDRAEILVDIVCGGGPLPPSGRRFDPDDLEAGQVEALRRATCAAADYLRLRGRAANRRRGLRAGGRVRPSPRRGGQSDDAGGAFRARPRSPLRHRPHAARGGDP